MNIIEQHRDGVPFLMSDGMAAAGGVAHGFSTRLGGVSRGEWASLNLGLTRGDDPACVEENYRRFLGAVGAQGNRVAMCNQVHGSTVRTVTPADTKTRLYQPAACEADALMTAIPGVTLVVFAADCVPILLYDPVRRVAAAVHAGWRGTAAGIASVAVEQMGKVYGCRPEHILAAVGPAIGPCCFETHEDVPNAITASMNAAALPYMSIRENGKFSVDLKGINVRRLEQAGLERAHIACCELCTACGSERFWSHRRMGDRRGSMAAAIQLKWD